MIEALKTRLEEIEDERNRLVVELAQAHEANMGATVEAVRTLIADAGYAPEEILPLLAPPAPKAKAKRSRSSGSDPRQFPVYAMADDPSRTYSRGKTPTWLRSAMLSASMDPDDRASRELFREQRMVRV